MSRANKTTARKVSARKTSPRKVTGKKTTTKRRTVGARSSAARRTIAATSSDGGAVGVVPARDKLTRLVAVMGNNRVADLLSVSPSQPSRWRAGQEGMSLESARRVADLEYVLSRLTQLYPETVAETWLTSHNAHLGARPADVLRIRGVVPVVSAIDAEAEGALV